MNANNIVISTLASAIIAYAIQEIGKNDIVALIAALVGIGSWVLYDFLP